MFTFCFVIVGISLLVCGPFLCSYSPPFFELLFVVTPLLPHTLSILRHARFSPCSFRFKPLVPLCNRTSSFPPFVPHFFGIVLFVVGFGFGTFRKCAASLYRTFSCLGSWVSPTSVFVKIVRPHFLDHHTKEVTSPFYVPLALWIEWTHHLPSHRVFGSTLLNDPHFSISLSVSILDLVY